ncbi:glycosyltransferase family 2 protein [Gramella sp. AN32]|uniref:Glycosyltransferase family 2 protein n=1 Tax=Christiangramia antarctica TaxID=2058158 RepID=A0ABW5WYY5_9FLAO|nr:glycosyltransferase family 2 protein [Gramella sp. AN32]MCM4155020.1 glycosyl transferase [Gramella sp. AN32]
MQEYGLVSVIMPAYNAETFIAEAIQSVIDQSYSNWELIIVNDASTDATEKVISAFFDDRISMISLKQNQGTHISRNKAIQSASGNFIAFLDADDLWKREKLQKQLAFMDENSASACFSSYELIDEQGIELNKKIEAFPVLEFQKLLKANYVGNLTGIYSVEKLGKIAVPDLRKRQDWGLWLEVVKKGGAMLGINESLAYYRVRKGSISSKKLPMLKYNFNIYHKVLKFNKIRSLYYMLIFLKEQLLVKPKQTKDLN